MSRKYLLLPALMICGAIAHAKAATFSAKAEEGLVTVYSTSEKPEDCVATVHFTYFDKDKGDREKGWTSCQEFITKPGKNVEVCHFKHPALVAPLLDGDVVAHCKDKAAPPGTHAQ